MDQDKPRVFTRTRERDGKQITQLAHSPADIVKFQFDGWTEVTGSEAARTVAAAEKTPVKADTAKK